MRPGRIGESGRDVGRPRTDPHAQTEIVPDIFETLPGTEIVPEITEIVPD